MRIVLAAVLLLGTRAWAVSQDAFSTFVQKNTGITGTPNTTRKACICHNGPLDHYAGWVVLDFNPPGQPAYFECVVPQWAADGQETIEQGCVDKGGTFDVLGK